MIPEKRNPRKFPAILLPLLFSALLFLGCGGGGGGTVATIVSVPVVEPLAASSISINSATLNGNILPNGLSTQAWFEYGSSVSLAVYSRTTDQSMGSGMSSQPITGPITGLTEATPYYFRVCASNLNGESKSSILSFTTSSPSGPSPTVATLAATSVLTTSATLNGNATPNSLSTNAWFEWGTDPSLTSSTGTTPQPIGAGTTSQPVTARLTGLTTGTTYYFRIAASNSSGTSRGAILSFVPSSSYPGVTPPSGVVTLVSNSWNYPDGNMTSIPRYKVWIDKTNGNNIWAIFGSNAGSGASDSYRSTDGGNSWTSFGSIGWDYHASLWGDDSNNLYIGSRSEPNGIALFRRYTGSWQSPVLFDDYTGSGNPTPSTANVIASAPDIWLIVRSSFGGSPQEVGYHRSTNSGATFGSYTSIAPVTNGVWHRIGSIMISGQPTAIVWDTEGSFCTIKLFRWNGSTFSAISNNTLQTASSDPSTRQFALTQTTDGNIHAIWVDIVGGNNVIRHSFRTLSGSWSAASTVVTIGAAGAQWSEPVLTHKGTTVYMAYRRNNGSYDALNYRNYTVGGGWSAETEISTSGGGSVRNLNTVQEVPDSANYIPFLYQTGIGPFSIRYRAVNVP